MYYFASIIVKIFCSFALATSFFENLFHYRHTKVYLLNLERKHYQSAKTPRENFCHFDGYHKIICGSVMGRNNLMLSFSEKKFFLFHVIDFLL